MVGSHERSLLFDSHIAVPIVHESFDTSLILKLRCSCGHWGGKRGSRWCLNPVSINTRQGECTGWLLMLRSGGPGVVFDWRMDKGHRTISPTPAKVAADDTEEPINTPTMQQQKAPNERKG